ncbi:MAG: hypothetical protein A2Y24_08040 [Clostridiales bacterium GWE2_32_10]|nr:MAG: hypothetical protein A2Y24_08040 [Clostridiales bacterium GWE2_32_10]HBY20939.1 hypothetical protein [Clostridiales bacterium]
MKTVYRRIPIIIIFLISAGVVVVSWNRFQNANEDVDNEKKTLQRTIALIEQKIKENEETILAIDNANTIKMLYPKKGVEAQINELHNFFIERAEYAKLTGMSPDIKEITENSELLKITITCSLLGTYNGLVQILEDLENLPIYKTISGTNIKYDSGTNKVNMAFQISTYALKKSSETSEIVTNTETNLEELFGNFESTNNTVLEEMRETQKKVESGIVIEENKSKQFENSVEITTNTVKPKTTPAKDEKLFPITKEAKILNEYDSIIYSNNGDQVLNRCIDLEVDDAAEVLSVEAGTVMYDGYLNEFGDTIMIKGNDNITYLYANLSSKYVGDGKYVAKGQHIGKVGEYKSYVKYLKFGVIENNVFVNPKTYIDTSKIHK